jgi:2-dehydropantoate 2-reductase
VFGVRLAHAGVDVDFVVRESRESETRGGPFRVERVDGGEALVVDAPSRVTAVPPHVDAVIVCVRVDQIDLALAMLKEGPAVPAVMMTPLLPRGLERAREALGSRAIAAISSVTGYVNDEGVARYWVSKSAKTTLDEVRPVDPAVGALVESLGRAGVESRLELGVHETSPATAILFSPLLFALDVAGSVDGFMKDKAVRDLGFRAFDEAEVLAGRIGTLAPWTSLLTKFIGPFMLRMSLGLVRRRAPEAIAFVERKFGRPNRAQNLAVGSEILSLALEKGTPHDALTDLVTLLH